MLFFKFVEFFVFCCSFLLEDNNQNNQHFSRDKANAEVYRSILLRLGFYDINPHISTEIPLTDFE